MSQLTSAQRYTISVMYKQGFAQKVIAETIKKDKSVVSRELKRNRNDRGEYSFTHAQMLADVRKERLSKNRSFTGEVKNRINRYMRKWQWSPEQIVGVCRLKGYAMVSVERIYQYIRQDKEQGGDLYKHCRHQLKHRKRPVGRHIPIKDRVSIDERPATADGTRYGDWEMDTIVGPRNKDAMLTLVERSQGFSIITRLPQGKDADGVFKAAYRELLPYMGYIRSITTDNGTESEVLPQTESAHEPLSEELIEPTVEVSDSAEPTKEATNTIETSSEQPDLYAQRCKEYQREQEQKRQDTIDAIMEYVTHTMSTYIYDNDELEKLLDAIRKWADDWQHIPVPIRLKSTLTTLDLRHFVWNIAERLGSKKNYTGEVRAIFIKGMFPDVMRDIELDSIRNFKFQPDTGSIVIDEPDKGDYHFHFE